MFWLGFLAGIGCAGLLAGAFLLLLMHYGQGEPLTAAETEALQAKAHAAIGRNIPVQVVQPSEFIASKLESLS